MNSIIAARVGHCGGHGHRVSVKVGRVAVLPLSCRGDPVIGIENACGYRSGRHVGVTRAADRNRELNTWCPGVGERTSGGESNLLQVSEAVRCVLECPAMAVREDHTLDFSSAARRVAVESNAGRNCLRHVSVTK